MCHHASTYTVTDTTFAHDKKYACMYVLMFSRQYPSTNRFAAAGVVLQSTTVWISFVELMFAGAYVMVPLQKFWIIFVAPHSLVVLGAKLALGRQLASSLSSQKPGKGQGKLAKARAGQG